MDLEPNDRVDAVVRYFTEDLGMRLPLGEMFRTDLADTLADEIVSASYIGREVIDDTDVHHVLGRGEAVDLQLWIAANGEPLPRRIVITYKAEPGQPQFRADLSEWDLEPGLSRDLFTFQAPQGAERIPVIPRSRRP